MDRIVINRHRDVDLTFSAPPSKSYTHRALFCAALADGISIIENPLYSGDTEVTCRALGQLGVRTERTADGIIVDGCGGVMPPGGDVTIDCEGSGTSLRFLATFALLYPGRVTLTGSERMKERPVGELAGGLRDIGGDIRFTERPGFPPVEISGKLSGGSVSIDASKSSQFISSMLISAPYAEDPVDIIPEGHVASESYLDITVDVMEKFGAAVERMPDGRFHVPSGAYVPRDYRVEGDYSSASYLFAIAAVCGGTVAVNNLNPDSVQGDTAFLGALVSMGCRVTKDAGSITVTRKGHLSGVDIDMSSSPDTVQTLAAVAVFAGSPTRITGVSHLIYKESDRIGAIGRMVEGCGAGFEYNDNEGEIVITPGEIHGFVLDPQDDHRTAMSGVVIGLGAGGVTIKDPECVGKSYPGFWDELRRAGL
ncbi:3-phosphoshikimate 1-carboxyvinyltransferase [Methanolacinia paynteri]|uniref:3-phosphoshikimate 1-carboxyvinyltransferase n=1 Tax=Methanolacinia paynteri TaxID=230356 RepID=UPI00064FCE6D|nr:3-phosphoshikimate 1-carboxyvinyltransferase [Methanolacinia paynteri]